MPLTAEQKIALMKDSGLDPDKYDVDEQAGEFVPKQTLAPQQLTDNANQTAQVAAPKPGLLGNIAGKAWNAATWSPIPSAETLVPETQYNPWWLKGLRGIGRAEVDIARGLASPLGVATLGGGGLAKAGVQTAAKVMNAARVPLAGLLGYTTAKGGIQTAKDIVAGEGTEAIRHGLGTLAGGAGTKAVLQSKFPLKIPEGLPKETPPQTIAETLSEPPLTPGRMANIDDLDASLAHLGEKPMTPKSMGKVDEDLTKINPVEQESQVPKIPPQNPLLTPEAPLRVIPNEQPTKPIGESDLTSNLEEPTALAGETGIKPGSLKTVIPEQREQFGKEVSEAERLRAVDAEEAAKNQPPEKPTEPIVEGAGLSFKQELPSPDRWNVPNPAKVPSRETPPIIEPPKTLDLPQPGVQEVPMLKGGMKMPNLPDQAQGGFLNLQVLEDMWKGMKELGGWASRDPISRVLDTPAKIYAAGRLNELFAQYTENLGKISNPLKASIRKEGLRGLKYDEGKLLQRVTEQENDTGQSLRHTLPPELQPIYDKYRQALQDVLNVRPANMPIMTASGPRPQQINPLYAPNILDLGVRDIISERPFSPEGQQFHNDWINYRTQVKGQAADAAEQDWQDFTSHLGEGFMSDRFFGASRRAAGLGLPPSMRSKASFDSDIGRYARSYARDVAQFNALENDPQYMWLSGRDTDYYGRPVVPPQNPVGQQGEIKSSQELQHILDVFRGASTGDYSAMPGFRSIYRLVTANLVGSARAVKNIFSGPIIGFRYIPEGGYGPYMKALLDWDAIKKGYEDAYKTGMIRRDMTTVWDLYEPVQKWHDKITQIANAEAYWTGLQGGTNLGKAWAMAATEAIMPIYRRQALAGDANALGFFKKLVPSGEWQSLPDEVLAKRLVETIHGTYDPRSLPLWAINSPMAPPALLFRWNIEQANNVLKYVLDPIRERGDYRPLFNTAIGAVVGGEVLDEISRLFNGKRGVLPDVEEILQADNPTREASLFVNKFLNLANQNGMLGAFGDIFEIPFQVANQTGQGRFPQYVPYEVATRVATEVSRAAGALMDGANFTDVIPMLVGKS